MYSFTAFVLPGIGRVIHCETIVRKYLPNAKIKTYKGGGRMIVQALLAGHVDAGVNDDLAVMTVLPDFPPNSVRVLDKRLGMGKDPFLSYFSSCRNGEYR